MSQSGDRASYHFPVTPELAKKLREVQLTAADWRLWSYLVTIEPGCDQANSATVQRDAKQECDFSDSTYFAAVLKLREAELLPDWFPFNQRENVERQIRDRLHQELGGLTEVLTAVGRIDLLTDNEVIEVKCAKGWKAALGQVIAYGSFYPNHRKRLHLFGKRLGVIAQTCSALDVRVTFEEVEE